MFTVAKNVFSLTTMRVGPFQVAEMGQKYVGLDKKQARALNGSVKPLQLKGQLVAQPVGCSHPSGQEVTAL